MMYWFAWGFKKNKVDTRRFFSFYMITVAGIACACTDDPNPAGSDLAYMPLRKGVYHIYDVDSVWYTAMGDHELHYELKTEVVDSFPNAESGYTYVIYRYQRDSPAGDWRYVDTWSARVNDLRAVVYEGAIPYVKFVLPVSEGRSWDGNAYNTLGKDEYEMINTRKEFAIEGEGYGDCIEVSQNDDNDVIVKTDIRREVYARNTGLILKEVRILNYCTAGCVEFGEIESGVVFSQKIKAYGIN